MCLAREAIYLEDWYLGIDSIRLVTIMFYRERPLAVIKLTHCQVGVAGRSRERADGGFG